MNNDVWKYVATSAIALITGAGVAILGGERYIRAIVREESPWLADKAAFESRVAANERRVVDHEGRLNGYESAKLRTDTEMLLNTKEIRVLLEKILREQAR